MTCDPFEICTCSCHDDDMEVYHVMACCYQCPHCGLNINRGYIEEHETRCYQEHLDAGLPVNQHNIFNGLTDLTSINDPVKPPPNPKTIHDEIREEIDREVLKELQECIDAANRREIEERPAVKFLRECQERERKLGK